MKLAIVALSWSAIAMPVAAGSLLSSAFISSPTRRVSTSYPWLPRCCSDVTARATRDSWSPGDDWNLLSSQHGENAVPDSDSIFNQDLAANAAQAMHQHSPSDSPETEWISNQVEAIHHYGFYFEPEDTNVKLYDVDNVQPQTVNFLDEMGREISMLVHCNQSPDQLLIHEGRALPPLTEQERNEASQLVIKDDTMDHKHKYRPTPFFTKAIDTMFDAHATRKNIQATSEPVMDAFGVASWMTTCLGKEGDDGKKRTFGPFDKHVLATISRFGAHGTGYMTRDNFRDLYLTAVTEALQAKTPNLPKSHYTAAQWKQLQQKPTLKTVWRDIRSHDMMGPIELERKQLQEEMDSRADADNGKTIATSSRNDNLWDECEILDYQDTFQPQQGSSSDDPASSRLAKSSHELVELAFDNKTPKRIRDGDFVFIDEQSCIGCTQCAQIAPSSFLMLDNGRARTFSQSNTPDVAMAVSSCPVNCMMRVSFRELKEMEISRDEENWDSVDKRHLNHRRGNIPLYVAGMDSDANHRSSWYHYLKQKCHMSKACPQSGCYDCPHFDAPGENPYFKKMHREAEHIRATDFSDSEWRKTADL